MFSPFSWESWETVGTGDCERCEWMKKHRLWKRSVSLHRGTVGGNMEGGCFAGDFERQVKEGSGNGASLSMGALLGEPEERAPLLRTLQNM